MNFCIDKISKKGRWIVLYSRDLALLKDFPDGEPRGLSTDAGDVVTLVHGHELDAFGGVKITLRVEKSSKKIVQKARKDLLKHFGYSAIVDDRLSAPINGAAEMDEDSEADEDSEESSFEESPT